MGVRDILRRGRRDLHKELQVPALYLVSKTDANPTLINVRMRVTQKPVAGFDVGALAIQMADAPPQIRFDLLQITPRRGGIVSVEIGEAYRIDNVKASDDEFVNADVVRLSAADAAGLPVPAKEDTYIPSAPGHPGMAVNGFNFTQATPATQWVINHQLGYRPTVDLFDATGAEIEGQVVHQDVNTVIVNFVTAKAGGARCV